MRRRHIQVEYRRSLSGTQPWGVEVSIWLFRKPQHYPLWYAVASKAFHRAARQWLCPVGFRRLSGTQRELRHLMPNGGFRVRVILDQLIDIPLAIAREGC